MSSTDDRGCGVRTTGEESPGFIGQGGGDSKASATEIYRQAGGFINVFTLVASVVQQ